MVTIRGGVNQEVRNEVQRCFGKSGTFPYVGMHLLGNERRPNIRLFDASGRIHVRFRRDIAHKERQSWITRWHICKAKRIIGAMAARQGAKQRARRPVIGDSDLISEGTLT